MTHLADKIGLMRSNVKVFDVSEHAVRAFRAHGATFEAPDWKLRQLLYDMSVADSDFAGAARFLSEAIQVPEKERLRTYVLIAQNFLAAEDSGNADSFVRRATECLTDDTEWTLLTQLKACRAKVQDARRNFLQAAQLYLELSQVDRDEVNRDELLEFLNKATICAVLARAGPPRQRLMGKIYSDSRAKGVAAFPMLERMYRERIVTAADATRFRLLLRTHQKAKLADGSTVLDRAIREHNTLAASRVYSSISFDALGSLLGTDAAAAERLAAEMIQTDRLTGSISQTDGMLVFASASATLGTWDRRLQDICAAITTSSERILRAHPELDTA